MQIFVIEIFPACLHQPVTRNAFDDGWGATYPSWFILPPTHDFFSIDWLLILLLLLIALTTINRFVSQNTDTAC